MLYKIHKLLLLKGWRKQAVPNRDRLVETMQQQQANITANNQVQKQQARNQEQQQQEQEHNFGIERPRAWGQLQGTFPESVALLRQAFHRLGLQNEESLQCLALWLVRSRYMVY